MPTKQLPFGIYFGLSEEKYRADPALNYSGMKRLLDSPSAFWQSSSLNPNRKPEKKTDEMEFGTQLHMLLFEPEKFKQTYCVIPGDKMDINKKIIRSTSYQKMVAMIDQLETMQHKTLLKVGAAEVVVVWRSSEHGIACKAKHDFFKTSCSVDYKTMHAIDNQNVMRAMYKYGYHMQGYHYVQSRKEIRQMILDGEADVYGADTPEIQKLIDGFLYGVTLESGRRVINDEYVMVVQETSEPYSYRYACLHPDWLSRGSQDADNAIRAYRVNMDVFGDGQPWRNGSGAMEQFNPFTGFQPIDEDN